MLLEFEKKIAGFIEAHRLFVSADKILLAVSGGADSTALMYAMCAIKAENILSGNVLCTHINHRLRGSESDGDEAFVVEQADKLNLAITTGRLDVRGFARKNKLSIEMAARQLRIKSLLDIAKTNNCNYIATAHQKNDNAETIIHRLIRGTGFRGLGSIWPKRNFAEGIEFVRPLLCVRRDEVVEYLRQRNLRWREDHTNVDCTYRRNFIRHRLIPALQHQCKGSIIEQLSELAQLSRKFHSLVCSSADKIWPQLANCADDSVVLDLKGFLTQHPAVKVEMVRRSLTHLGSGERDLTEQHYGKVLQLAKQKTSGGKVELPGGFVVRREYDKLIFARVQKSAKLQEQVGSIEILVPGRTRFGRYFIEADIFEAEEKKFEEFKAKKDNFVEWFDLDNVKLPLVIRSREDGDRFVPLGLREEKKVGKFLTAAKVPQQIRKKMFIVTDIEKIIWLWPVRISEQAKVTRETRKILQLRMNDVESAD